ncbi:TrmH family RNA methyltransferase [Sandarakinorhabdus rubra]|uniref:TrmH family RNA methyltransferase n=1 Tax=Sandarakinorhabdus rubra TaxID=2672568 RepID=UPI0013DBEB92|nr:RNA methyltransferase [Sandarakinorhabdus rubra]
MQPRITDVTSPANPVLKSLKSLADKKGRRAAGQFLAEGLRVCTEALAAGHVPATLVFTAEAERHPLTEALIAATAQARGTCLRTTPDLMQRLTGKDNAAGVAAAYPIPDTSLARIDRSTAPLWLVAENLKDPGNFGTMLRTCDATGAGGVILLDQSCDPFSVEAVRASMGALFSRQVGRATGAEFFQWLRAGEGQLVGAALGEASVDYRAHRYAAPCFLFMGNEQSGLPDAYAAQCDALVKLPMLGTADSLNVAVCAGVLLYHALDALSAA